MRQRAARGEGVVPARVKAGSSGALGWTAAGTTALWGVCALIVCGVAMQLVWPDLTFPALNDEEHESDFIACMGWLFGSGMTNWLPLVLPAGLAARWQVPAAAAPD